MSEGPVLAYGPNVCHPWLNIEGQGNTATTMSIFNILNAVL